LEERLSLWDKRFGFANEEQQNQFNPDVHLDTHGIPKRTISLMWNQRSVDTFLGLPFNIASYGLLLEIIAKEVNMIPDELIGNLGDVHLYSNHIEQAREQIFRDPYDLPKLVINENNKMRIGGGISTYVNDNFTLENYKSHPSIKAPLSN
jgi:thymidylate synthase